MIFEKLFRKKKSEPVPLEITDKAVKKIRSQLASRPVGIRSVFKIEVDYRKESYSCSVGFMEKKDEIRTLYSYPIEISISAEDERFLEKFTLEYSDEDSLFYVYPNVEMEIERLPAKNIVRYSLNREIFHPESPLKEIATDKESVPLKIPAFIKKLFQAGAVSVYAKERFFQIEFPDSDITEEQEDIFAEIIKEYYDSCSYPLSAEANQIIPKRQYFSG
ncbi:MAG TPA: hypothetical protein PL048_12920 [Leptospiraceae bacterium]|nr:hypothetical protein [Leptospiraceae bacterium]HMY68300.1 hypothetical protein [Leptospiraceae bacterium]HMZ59675.1 hypothetical protein [Leptospiraceae bacterium]HNF13665.1 hypothetical protein [Leptospiraceae bacterium]HNF24499.1 hypothetical protein [Leptospiraceae bacterium]